MLGWKLRAFTDPSSLNHHYLLQYQIISWPKFNPRRSTASQMRKCAHLIVFHLNQLVNVGNPLYTVTEDKHWNNRVRWWRGRRRRRRRRWRRSRYRSRRRSILEIFHCSDLMQQRLFSIIWDINVTSVKSKNAGCRVNFEGRLWNGVEWCQPRCSFTLVEHLSTFLQMRIIFGHYANISWG